MASPCDNRLTVNIKNLPIVTDVNNGDFLIVEAPDGTSILDFRNFLITLDNTTFKPTFLNYNTRIDAISADLASSNAQLSGNIVAIYDETSQLSNSILQLSSSVLFLSSSIDNNDLQTSESIASVNSKCEWLSSSIDELYDYLSVAGSTIPTTGLVNSTNSSDSTWLSSSIDNLSNTVNGLLYEFSNIGTVSALDSNNIWLSSAIDDTIAQINNLTDSINTINTTLSVSQSSVPVSTTTGGVEILPIATKTSAGLMSGVDKTRLDNIAKLNGVVSSNGSGGFVAITGATSTADGLMSKTDKRRFDKAVYVNGVVKSNGIGGFTAAGNATTSADGLMSSTDKTRLNKASNVSGVLSGNGNGDFAAVVRATSSKDGLMSSVDKARLNDASNIAGVLSGNGSGDFAALGNATTNRDGLMSQEDKFRFHMYTPQVTFIEQSVTNRGIKNVSDIVLPIKNTQATNKIASKITLGFDRVALPLIDTSLVMAFVQPNTGRDNTPLTSIYKSLVKTTWTEASVSISGRENALYEFSRVGWKDSVSSISQFGWIPLPYAPITDGTITLTRLSRGSINRSSWHIQGELFMYLDLPDTLTYPVLRYQININGVIHATVADVPALELTLRSGKRGQGDLPFEGGTISAMCEYGFTPT